MIGNGPHLFCFGLGFSAEALARRLLDEGWQVSGTCRGEAKRQRLAALGIAMHLFDRDRPLADPASALAGVTDIVASVPPDAGGDPVLDLHEAAIVDHPGLRWVGYLSTTGVYGDTGGAPVDETAPLNPTAERSRRRVEAEGRWLALERSAGLPVHVFRLAGIYGPGRSPLDQVRAGEVRRIARPGHAFSRIHVDDIAQVLRASMARPDPGRIYNVCDDEPAEPADVVAFACRLLGREPPPPVPFEVARTAMSAMALSFWADNRRVDNSRIKRELGIDLAHPDYRAGLRAILAAEAGRAPATAG
jgi:nucleoside-diphosphate-sugar epimerase